MYLCMYGISRSDVIEYLYLLFSKLFIHHISSSTITYSDSEETQTVIRRSSPVTGQQTMAEDIRANRRGSKNSFFGVGGVSVHESFVSQSTSASWPFSLNDNSRRSSSKYTMTTCSSTRSLCSSMNDDGSQLWAEFKSELFARNLKTGMGVQAMLGKFIAEKSQLAEPQEKAEEMMPSRKPVSRRMSRRFSLGSIKNMLLNDDYMDEDHSHSHRCDDTMNSCAVLPGRRCSVDEDETMLRNSYPGPQVTTTVHSPSKERRSRSLGCMDYEMIFAEQQQRESEVGASRQDTRQDASKPVTRRRLSHQPTLANRKQLGRNRETGLYTTGVAEDYQPSLTSDELSITQALFDSNSDPAATGDVNAFVDKNVPQMRSCVKTPSIEHLTLAAGDRESDDNVSAHHGTEDLLQLLLCIDSSVGKEKRRSHQSWTDITTTNSSPSVTGNARKENPRFPQYQERGIDKMNKITFDHCRPLVEINEDGLSCADCIRPGATNKPTRLHSFSYRPRRKYHRAESLLQDVKKQKRRVGATKTVVGNARPRQDSSLTSTSEEASITSSVSVTCETIMSTRSFRDMKKRQIPRVNDSWNDSFTGSASILSASSDKDTARRGVPSIKEHLAGDSSISQEDDMYKRYLRIKGENAVTVTPGMNPSPGGQLLVEWGDTEEDPEDVKPGTIPINKTEQEIAWEASTKAEYGCITINRLEAAERRVSDITLDDQCDEKLLAFRRRVRSLSILEGDEDDEDEINRNNGVAYLPTSVERDTEVKGDVPC